MLQKIDRTEAAIIVALIAFPFLIYWPVLSFPYLLSDENWLLRGWSEPDYPGKGFIAILQGRPALMVMSYGSALLFQAFGEFGIQIMRAAAIAATGVSSVLLYIYSRHFSLTKPYRVFAAALWVTLPAAQIIIANGTWLSVGVAAAIGAMIILDYRLAAASAAAAILLLWLAATTYQSCYFIAPALFAITFYNRPRKEALMAGAIIAGSFLAYYVAWRLLFSIYFPGSTEARYNPNALPPLTELIEHVRQHVKYRFRIITNVWDITTSFPSVKTYVVTLITAAALASAALSIKSRASAMTVATAAFYFLAALFIADFPVLASKAVVWSYTTFIGITIIMSLAAAIALSPLMREQRIAIASCIAILAFGGTLASASVARHFAIPTWLATEVIRGYIQERAEQQPTGPLTLCFIGTRDQDYPGSPDPSYGQSEFSWTNSLHEFYAYWHSRTQMQLIGINRTLKAAVVRDADPSKKEGVYPYGVKAECKPGEYLDLSKITKNDLFRRGIVEPQLIR